MEDFIIDTKLKADIAESAVITELNIFYIMPVSVFNDYKSEISLVETTKRQRRPRSAEYRERWD